MRLDEEKLEALRSWGERLSTSSTDEHAAIGRAILMLATEIDRLHIDLWHARMAPTDTEPVTSPEKFEEPVASSLHERLRRTLRRNERVQEEEQPGSDKAGESTSVAQAWLAELRRQQ